MKKFETMSFTEKVGGLVILSPFAFVIIGAIFIYGQFSMGYVTMNAYNWFVLPVLPSFPKLDMYHFAGFSLFVAALRSRGVQIDKIKDEYMQDKTTIFYKQLLYAFVKPWAILAFAYFLKLVIEHYKS